MTNNKILVQEIEAFDTITTHESMDAFDAWMDGNNEWGIVSLDIDPDGEYAYVALVAATDGPDYDTVTNEPIVDAAAELEAKLDIMMEIDDAETITLYTQTQGDTMSYNETPELPETHEEPSVDTTEDFDAGDSHRTEEAPKATKKLRGFERLAAFISANPGVSRTDVFNDAGLQSALRTKAQVAAIAKGDKAETKRWNRRLNFLIREMRRQGVDIQIERKGRVAHYTIIESNQLELPFTPAAVKRNSTIIGGDVADEVLEEASPIEIVVDAKRADEPANVSLNFEDLLAQLDEDEATITSDDQVAFKAAKEMLK